MTADPLTAGSALGPAPPLPAPEPPGPRPVFDLLPTIHRIRDVAQGGPLSVLLGVVEDELLRLRDDVDGLYDDWFVETCAEWVIPYLGDLLGVQGLRPVPSGVVSQRALVANTIRYRRRKGTLAVLEQVARDVTGWPARAVEYFRLLGGTQHLDHVRPSRAGTADLRNADALSMVGTPFDQLARTVDVRHIDSGRGRYNLPNVGLYLWRLVAYRVEGADARAVDAALGRWTFDPAGRDLPLFHPARPQPGDVPGLAEEPNVPAPLCRRALLRDLAAAQPVYLAEPDPAFRVTLDDVPVPISRLVCCDLDDWRRPPAGAGDPTVAVDPVLGRITVPDGVAPHRIRLDYAYGGAGDVGAGPFDRRPPLAAALAVTERPTRTTVDWVVRVAKDAEPVPGRTVPTIAEALLLWNSRTNLEPGQIGVIAVTDSATYRENLDVVLPTGDRLVLVASGVPAVDKPQGLALVDVTLTARGLRPHLVGDTQVTGADGSEFLLDGVSVEGGLTVLSGGLARLVVSDSTFLTIPDPARPDAGWVTSTGNPHLAVTALRTVCAGLRLPGTPAVDLSDCVLYGGAGPGPAVGAPDAAAQVDGCTILGQTTSRTLSATNSIFDGLVTVSHRQQGCVRFSYLPLESRSPRRYRCVPSDADHARSVVPRFTAVVPGDPGFAQLGADCPVEITEGADDEGELGVFHFLQQSQRRANLASQLDQYLCFGLEAGVFFAT